MHASIRRLVCRMPPATCLRWSTARTRLPDVALRSQRAFDSSSTTMPPPPQQQQPSSSVADWSAALPEVPYGFPASPAAADLYAAERSGGLPRRWLRDLPRHVQRSTATGRRGDAASPSAADAAPSASPVLRIEHYLPSKEELWRSPPYEALREIALSTPYHDTLRTIMEHDYRFLFSDVLCHTEAPMPHVVYEDFMKCLTFASRQRPPEEQFALEDDVLRDVLCWAAYYCTVDPFYFTSASLLFRKVEQEQHLSPAVHSAWVYICTAAGRIDEALHYAAYMEAHDIPFDADVFARMLHPSLTPAQQRLQHAPQTSKGIVLQRRLSQDMRQHHGTTAVAVHAMFVYHILTLRHTRKWEVLRAGAEFWQKGRDSAGEGMDRNARRGAALATATSATLPRVPEEVISSRTMQLAVSLYCAEKGVRWGPRTTAAMVAFMMESEDAGCTAADVLYVLMRVRRNERSAVLASLPRTAFTEDAQAALLRAAQRRSRRDAAWGVAAPLLRELLAADGASAAPDAGNAAGRRGDAGVHGSDAAVAQAMEHLQRLAAHASDATPTSSLLSAAQTATTSPLAVAEGGQAEVDGLLPEAGVRTTSTATSAAVVARDVLAAVMALDRESVTSSAAATAASAASPRPADTPGQSREAADAEADTRHDADRLHDLYAALESAGTSVSLTAWSLQQAEQEAATAQLSRQAPTSWISPSYVSPDDRA